MSRQTASRGNRGHSLIELLIAMAITLAITGATLALISHAQTIAQAQPEAADMQQRLRVAVDALDRSLLIAGGGQSDVVRAGPSGNVFPSVMPYRAGYLANDVRAGVSYRPDAISIVSVTPSASQTVLVNSMPDGSAPIEVAPQPNCPTDDALCGFRVGMHAIISDYSGTYDVFEISSVESPLFMLQHDSSTFQKPYGAGSRVSEADLRIYYFDARSGQLRYSDGVGTDLPLVDNVVDLQFAYFGEALTPLDPVSLRDGPWWGSGLSVFDADLLRIRAVRVTLRVQAALSTLRGADRQLFRRPGTAGGDTRFLPDLSVAFDVSPRNLLWVR